MANVQGHNDKPPGYGVPYLALADGFLLLSMTMLLLTLFVPQSVQGRLQGVITFLVALLLTVLSVARLYATIAVLTLMLSLFVAPPFGTLTYIALWGFFATGTAKAILAAAMFCKIGFAVFLVLAQPGTLKVKSMVFLIVVSLALTFIVALLHGVVPGVLASITDAIAGIVDAVFGIILGAAQLLTSVFGILRALRIGQASAHAEG